MANVSDYAELASAKLFVEDSKSPNLLTLAREDARLANGAGLGELYQSTTDIIVAEKTTLQAHQREPELTDSMSRLRGLH